VRYEKPPLTFDAQADQLISRGLITDKTLLVDRLKHVNYYRLSGYLFPYRQEDNTFKPGTTFEKVWHRYSFDRHLRLVVMDAIERIEVSVRTQLIYELAQSTGAFGYTDQDSLPNLKPDDYTRWIGEITKETLRSREMFVHHFRKKYGDSHEFLPLWMAGEIVSFGCTFTMYKGVSASIRNPLAAFYGVSEDVLTSWLQTINVIRNVCAHHSRLWNRELGVKPFIPRKNKYPQWHTPVEIPQNRIFGVLTILHYFLTIIAPQSKWKSRLYTLLNEYPEISRWSMGFPDNWKESPLWKD